MTSQKNVPSQTDQQKAAGAEVKPVSVVAAAPLASAPPDGGQAPKDEPLRVVPAESALISAQAAAARRAAFQAERADRERQIAKIGSRRDPAPLEALNGGPAGAQVAPPKPAPTVRPAKLRRRHCGVLISLVLMVILPTAVSSWYLWTRAVDQYESQVGFAVRAEGQSVSPDIFGGLLGATGSPTSEDMHILSEFILSQEIVRLIDARLDLRKRFSLYSDDPVYTFHPEGTIEDLVDYWQRMVVADFDTSSGLMNLTVYAFTPKDAQEISAAILEESTNVINSLSDIARDDSTKYARDGLEVARARANDARAALAAFREKNQVADPAADLASQLGVVASLQNQMAAALVELDMIRANGQSGDPRILQLERRITVINGRISQERASLGIGANGSGFAEVLSEYERLTVDKTFAEQAYLAALSGFDVAIATVSQKSRYLAQYTPPTLAEASTAPNRPLMTFLVGVIAFFSWSSMVLIYYALRDRR